MIGFVGLGNMGAHMARNLLKSGHKLVVYDLQQTAIDSLKTDGASSCSSPADVAEQVSVLVTMLPSNPHVEEAYSGPKGIFKTLKPNALCLDSSTIEPIVSKRMASFAQQKKAIYMDAPVSGGVNAAKDALLTFMVGGEEVGFKQAQPILAQMGKNIVYCGQSGNGQAAKICNNMLLAISMIGVAETMNLGQRLGLNAELLAKIINSSSGRCWSSDVYNPVPGVMPNVPSSRNYEGGFGSTLMAKDLSLAQNAATQAACPTPLGSLAHQLYRIMCQSGYANKDFSSVYQFLAQTNRA